MLHAGVAQATTEASIWRKEPVGRLMHIRHLLGNNSRAYRWTMGRASTVLAGVADIERLYMQDVLVETTIGGSL